MICGGRPANIAGSYPPIPGILPIKAGCIRLAKEVGVAGGGPLVSMVALMPSSSAFLGTDGGLGCASALGCCCSGL